jgi:hypothetical protein
LSVYFEGVQAHNEGEVTGMETSGRLHPGINFHRLPVSGGAAGLLVAVSSTLIFLFGFPWSAGFWAELSFWDWVWPASCGCSTSWLRLIREQSSN